VNREAIKAILQKANRVSLFLAFITIFGLVSIYSVEYIQGDTSQTESMIEPAVTVFMIFCVIAAFCRLGVGMLEAWEKTNK
jgi:hypothetical protein